MAKNPDPMIPTRRSLLSRLKNWDDRTSWQEFFDTYWKVIYGVAIKAGLSDTEAQEVVQETVIAVARNMQAFKYDPATGTFKSWLLHTTRWKITDQFRRRLPANDLAHRADTQTAGTTLINRIPDPAGLNLAPVWDEEWEKNLFDAARERVKQRVDDRQYQMFDLYAIKNWPVKKVATALGVNAARIYLAKHRIVALIRKEIQKLERSAPRMSELQPPGNHP
jgi:RNA polymerase sigma factor (sigma-70 family)